MFPAKPVHRSEAVLGGHAPVVEDHGPDPGIDRTFDHVRCGIDSQCVEIFSEIGE